MQDIEKGKGLVDGMEQAFRDEAVVFRDEAVYHGVDSGRRESGIFRRK